MSTFNINRFGQALKCQFVVTRKDWMRVFVIYVIALTFMGLFITRKAEFNYLNYDDALQKYGEAYMMEAYSQVIQGILVFHMVFFCFAMLFCASFLFHGLKTTSQRSAYFTWPVSNLEKFIVCLLHNVVLAAVGTILSIVIADALRVLVDAVDGRVIVWSVSYWPSIFHVEKNLAAFYLSVITMCLYIHSFYILGATFFRKQHFILTSMSIVAFLVVFVKIIELILGWLGWQDKSISIVNNGDITNHLLYWSFIIVLWALIVFHYSLSYKLFSRMQVINNKWLNV